MSSRSASRVTAPDLARLGAALEGRSRQLAHALGLAERWPDGSGGLGTGIQQIAAETRRRWLDRDPEAARATWLLAVGLSGTLPTESTTTALREHLLGAEPGAELVGALRATFSDASRPGALTRRLDLVTDSLVVDVTFSARHERNTGIQRVVRRLCQAWEESGVDVVLVALDADAGAFRRLTMSERDRVLQWDNRTNPVDDAVDDDAVVVPWGSAVVLSDVPDAASTAVWASLGRDSGNTLTVIGYDAIPTLSTDDQSIEQAARFVDYLDVIHAAHRVAAISGSAAEEFAGIAEMMSARGGRVPELFAVPLAVDPVRSSPVSVQKRVPGRLLCVGSHEPRKNQHAVIRAAIEAHRQVRELELVLVGGGSSEALVDLAEVVAHARRAGLRVSVLRDTGDEALHELYRTSAAVVFASKHEGYGLPVVEALAEGTPVITSAHGSMAELAAGGGCLLVDPRDEEAIARAMVSILTDDALARRLREEASLRTRRSWRDYADEIRAVALDMELQPGDAFIAPRYAPYPRAGASTRTVLLDATDLTVDEVESVEGFREARVRWDVGRRRYEGVGDRAWSTLALIVPRAVLQPERAEALQRLVEREGLALHVVGEGCRPLTVAEPELRASVGELCRHLALVARAATLTPIDDTAALEYRGWIRALAGTGLSGPRLLETSEWGTAVAGLAATGGSIEGL